MPEPDRFDLFAFWRTSATYRVRVALNLKQLSAHERVVDIDAGENRSPEFLAINPLGAIPALIDHQEPGGLPLTQSLAILEFLEDVQPTPPLLPEDPHGRARVRALAGMLASDTHPLIVPRVRKYLAANAGFDDAAWRAWQTNWFTTGLQAVEHRLANESQTGAFCHGHAVTIADICLASIVVVQRIFRINVHDIPNVDRIMANCENLEAFAKASPANQFGAPQAS
jgi:maleylacetoacetate isomerase/maleylpyruvate isomerase